MSKATRQSACLISAISASFYYLYAKKFFSRVDIKESIEQGYEFSIYMAKIWNKYGDEGDFEYAVKIIHDWDEYIRGRDSFYDAATYVYLVSRITNDLKDKLNNQVKLRTLDQLSVPLGKLEKFVDPTGANFLACEEGDKALNCLYELIGWEW